MHRDASDLRRGVPRIELLPTLKLTAGVRLFSTWARTPRYKNPSLEVENWAFRNVIASLFGRPKWRSRGRGGGGRGERGGRAGGHMHELENPTPAPCPPDPNEARTMLGIHSQGLAQEVPASRTLDRRGV